MPYNKFILVQVLDLEAIAGGTPVHGKAQCIHIYTLRQFSMASPPTDFFGGGKSKRTLTYT